MIPLKEFQKWFNHGFWKAFTNLALPIYVPSTKAERAAVVEKVYNSIITARYSPSLPEAEVVVNKGLGVARSIPVFSIEDYIVYFFCIKELESILSGNRTANTFGGWSLGGKTRIEETEEMESEATDYGRYAFNPNAWREAFSEFNALLFAQLDTGRFQFVLQFDLSNFYDSVRLDILQRWIREEAPSDRGWIITLLFYFLNQWNRQKTGLHPQAVGLPQDALADCSRILSNFYLRKYDRFAFELCTMAGAVYFRYSDDQMILLESKEHISTLMLLLARKLDRFGLRVNQKKVVLWDVKQLQEHRCRQIHSIFSQKGDNKEPKLVRKFVNAYFALSPSHLIATLNGGSPLLNRMLFANLESLPKALLRKLVGRFVDEKFLVWADHKKLARIHELHGLSGSKVDLLKRLHDLGSVWVHNSFHIEAELFARKTKNPVLVKHFAKRLKTIHKQMADNDLQ